MADFVKAMGMEAKRIPVILYIWDRERLSGAWTEKKVFNWAEKWIAEDIDRFYTARGQNGLTTSRYLQWVCKCLKPEEVEFVLTVLEQLAKYSKKGAVGYWSAGMDQSTESVGAVWCPNRYPAVDKEMAAPLHTGCHQEALYENIPKEKYVAFTQRVERFYAERQRRCCAGGSSGRYRVTVWWRWCKGYA